MKTHFSVVTLFVLLAGSVPSANTYAQQNPSEGSMVASAQAPSFAEVVKNSFSEWDSNGDGILSTEEVVAALSNPKIRAQSAAGIVAVDKVIRGGDWPSSQVSAAQKALATTRMELRAQGFKTDLTNFDFSTSPELRAREAVLTAAAPGRKAGSMVTLDCGGKVPRQRRLRHPAVPPKRQYFAWRPWRQ